MPTTYANLYDSFLLKLMKDSKTDQLPENIRDRIKEQLSQELQTRVGILIASHLKSADSEELNSLMTTSTPGEIEKFLRLKLPNLDKLIEKELGEFRKDYLSAVKEK